MENKMKLEKKVYVDGFNLGNIGPFPGIDYYIHLSFEDSMEKASDYKKFEGRWAKLILETEEPILDDVEKEYLSGVIRPFRDKIKFIRKNCIYGQEYINVVYNSKFKDDTNFCLPLFETNTMYKGMELNKEYTLKELGL